MRPLLLLIGLIACTSFTTTDRSKAAEGPFTVYVFLAQRCNICKFYTPTLKELHAEYAPKGVSFVGIFPNKHSDLQAIAAFDQAFDMPFPLAQDLDNLSERFGATVTPEVVLVDGQGAVVYQGRIDNSYVRVGRRRSQTTSSELNDALKAVTSGKPIDVTRTDAIGCIIERTKP